MEQTKKQKGRLTLEGIGVSADFNSGLQGSKQRQKEQNEDKTRAPQIENCRIGIKLPPVHDETSFTIWQCKTILGPCWIKEIIGTSL